MLLIEKTKGKRVIIIKLMIFEAESGVYAYGLVTLFLLLQGVAGFWLFFFFSFALKLVVSQYILSSHHNLFSI